MYILSEKEKYNGEKHEGKCERKRRREDRRKECYEKGKIHCGESKDNRQMKNALQVK